MADQVVRFGVRSPDARRSGVFRIWANHGKSDSYIAARSVAGDFKVSLHESGVWQVGFTTGHVEGRSPGSLTSEPLRSPEMRIQDRWERPSPSHPGITRAFAIVVSGAGVQVPITADESKVDIHWYPKPAKNPSVEFNVYLTAPDAKVTGWPGRGMGTEYIGSFELANGETLWVVAHEPRELLDLPGAPIPLLDGESEHDAVRRLFGDGPYENLRVLAVGKDEDGTRLFVETALQITEVTEEAPP